MGRTTDIDVLIGRNLRLLRAHHQMRQRDVASRMLKAHPTWHWQTVSDVERGQRAILVSEARDLAAIFGVSLDFLLEKIEL